MGNRLRKVLMHGVLMRMLGSRKYLKTMYTAKKYSMMSKLIKRAA